MFFRETHFSKSVINFRKDLKGMPEFCFTDKMSYFIFARNHFINCTE